MAAAVHHIEIWVPDLSRALNDWGWVLHQLGWKDGDGWPGGFSWRSGVDSSYLVVEQSPAMSAATHDRLRFGLNHLALNAAGRAEVDAIVADAAGHGWTLMFADRHPYAGGPQHYAAFLHNQDGYELEIVAPG
ncbi:VOC family protein [Kribbella sp. CA-293567]|uniref:VOC family protein n=1 Tax=Kribbella sp. CA-293567 TaxID=3002436 RepID=UPI0022DE0205|nr:VOC family protein [Kribbella sp. CA-293567]WBQ07845.1 VOC family protein [Kribbella sp. CA-293567]